MALNNRATPTHEESAQAWVSLGVVIPTLNNSMTILRALESIDQTSVGYRRDVVVVDGGSTDNTVEIAKSWGARVITAPPGRGSQIAHGVEEVKGDWMLFLHPGTELSHRWLEEALKFMRDPAKFTTAGYFKLEIRDEHKMARWLEQWADFRSRNLGVPYGNQGLIISRVLYKKIGQIRDIPIMEDVDFVQRIGRNSLQHLHATAKTSAEEYRREGWIKRSVLNGFCLFLFKLGFEIDFIKGIYGKSTIDNQVASGQFGALAAKPSIAPQDRTPEDAAAEAEEVTATTDAASVPEEESAGAEAGTPPPPPQAELDDSAEEDTVADITDADEEAVAEDSAVADNPVAEGEATAEDDGEALASDDTAEDEDKKQKA